MSKELTKIMLWKNDLNKYEEVGTIDEENGNIIYKNYTVKSVTNMNTKILNYIKKHQKTERSSLLYEEESLFDVLKEGDINSYIVNYIKWRRCSAYLVIQISNRGYRYLCYFVDKIYHTAKSFGTSYSNVDYETIKQKFKIKINTLNAYKLKKYEDLSYVLDLSERCNNSDIKTNFGI